MTELTLNTHVFLASVETTGATGWHPVDWRHNGDTVRRIVGTKHNEAPDTLIVETQIQTDTKPQYSVITTATTFSVSAAGAFSTNITDPCTHIRVRHTGGNSKYTVIGIV